MKRENRRLAAIVSADIAGFSRLIGQDEEGTLRALRAHRKELIDKSIEAHGGRIANTAGDSLLLEFPSVVDAARCTLEVQTGMAIRNGAVALDGRIEFRIGINLGDVVAEGTDLLGDGVNVAARLQEIADPGGIIVSNAAYEQIRDRLAITFVDMGGVAVKNIARPVRAFRVASDRPRQRNWLNWQRITNNRALRPAAVATLFLAILTAVIMSQWRPSVDRGALNTDKPSIAVLPFVNLSSDDKQEYLADGITDDLITDLSKVSGLLVIARNSAFAYKGKALRVQDIASELGVGYVLEGTVRRSVDGLRISANLIEEKSGRNLWAERYDRDFIDVLAVQDEVVGRIVSALSVKLTTSEQAQLSEPRIEDPKAYDHYLRALRHYYSGDATGLRESLHASKKAIANDPKFARAYAIFARAAVDIWRLDFISVMPPPLARKEAIAAANKALQLDPKIADAHYVRALLKMVDGEHLKAVDEARRAVYLDRNSAEAYLTLAIVLGYSGRHAEAMDTIKIALRLDPRPSRNLIRYHGWVMVMNHNFQAAIDVLKPISEAERGPFYALGDTPDELLAIAYIKSGQEAEAKQHVEKMLRQNTFMNINYLRVIYSHHKRAKDLNFRLDALRQASLPTCPYDHNGKEDNRLDNLELNSLATQSNWTGWDMSTDLNCIRQTDKDGLVVYANRETLMSGKTHAEGEKLCEQFDIYMLGRKQCGYVYKNPDGTPQESNEYIYVTPTTILRFSVEE